MSSSLDALLKLFKTTSLQKLFAYDCVFAVYFFLHMVTYYYIFETYQTLLACILLKNIMTWFLYKTCLYYVDSTIPKGYVRKQDTVNIIPKLMFLSLSGNYSFFVLSCCLLCCLYVCLCVILSLNHVISIWHVVFDIFYLCVILSSWHFVFMTFCLYDILSLWHFDFMTFCLYDILSLWHFVFSVVCVSFCFYDMLSLVLSVCVWFWMHFWKGF